MYISTLILACKNDQILPAKTKLTGLNPFLDRNGLLRMGSRLANSSLPYNTKYPLILPSDDKFTSLLIQESHQRTLHGGPQLMIQYLRNQYWIVNLRRLTKDHVSKCLACFRQKKATGI